MKEEILTLEELSQYLKIPKSTVYKLCQEGKIPGQKVGRHWRFRKATIDIWMDEQREDLKKGKENGCVNK